MFQEAAAAASVNNIVTGLLATAVVTGIGGLVVAGEAFSAVNDLSTRRFAVEQRYYELAVNPVSDFYNAKKGIVDEGLLINSSDITVAESSTNFWSS